MLTSYQRLLEWKARRLGGKGRTRRDLMLLSLGLAGVAAGWQIWIRRPRDLEFAEIDGLSGWRRIVSEQVTQTGGNASQAVFLGIGQGEAIEPLPPNSLCEVLYPGERAGLRAAYFTDVNCPNCRRLEDKLTARRHLLQTTILDLPLMGENSRQAAKAAIAAELQGRGPEFRRELTKSGFASQLVGRLARASGSDIEGLLADMESNTVHQRLRLARRAAETLGIYGTPALTVGRTLIMGDVPASLLDQIIEIEAEKPFSGC